MKIIVIAVGRLRGPGRRELADDYAERIRRYSRFEEVEVKSDAALARASPDGAFVVACDVRGEPLGSEGFAEKLGEWVRRDKGVVAFLIGGAEGIPKEVSRAAHARLSLSAMTLPHQLARVVLFEQIYRAFTILRGEPYAREAER